MAEGSLLQSKDLFQIMFEAKISSTCDIRYMTELYDDKDVFLRNYSKNNAKVFFPKIH